jgi:hypothetical protein
MSARVGVTPRLLLWKDLDGRRRRAYLHQFLNEVVWPSRIDIEHDGECVARHQRCYGCGHQILNLEHYLDVLEKKPGAMDGSTPLEQWRQAGRWPECLVRIPGHVNNRSGVM